jgi:hypothetical protein
MVFSKDENGKRRALRTPKRSFGKVVKDSFKGRDQGGSSARDEDGKRQALRTHYSLPEKFKKIRPKDEIRGLQQDEDG